MNDKSLALVVDMYGCPQQMSALLVGTHAQQEDGGRCRFLAGGLFQTVFSENILLQLAEGTGFLR